MIVIKSLMIENMCRVSNFVCLQYQQYLKLNGHQFEHQI